MMSRFPRATHSPNGAKEQNPALVLFFKVATDMPNLRSTGDSV
jgi:hypothetical protein